MCIGPPKQKTLFLNLQNGPPKQKTETRENQNGHDWDKGPDGRAD